MSFSRAKLLRFNDINSSTPSPADYTIPNNGHVSGAALSKSERFAELSSPASSDISVCSQNSNLPVFRTPNPPPRRKPKQNNGTSTFKPVDLFQSQDSLEALKEKIVECNNKDQYITEIMEQVEDMKHQLSSCNYELSTLITENSRLTETLENVNADKVHMLNNQQKDLNDIQNKLITVYNTHNTTDDTNSKCCKNSNDLNTLLENIGILDDLLESYKVMNDRNLLKLEDKEQQLLHLENQYCILQHEHNIEIAKLKEAHNAEIELKESEAKDLYTKDIQRKNEHIQELQNQNAKIHNDFEAEIHKLNEAHQVKIQQLTENFREASVLADIQFEEKCCDIEKSWQLKLEETKKEADDILKECQAIAEYNIIQSEIEKNQVVYDLNEHKDLLKSLKEKYEFKRSEFMQLTEQYEIILKKFTAVEETKVQVDMELETCKGVVTQLTNTIHKYEITIIKTHELIETLKKRLMNSDKDVEQLKTELEGSEASKIVSEGKCNELEEELQIVLRLFNNMSSEVKVNRVESKEKVQQVEKELLSKVDHFKKEADAEIAKLNKELDSTKSKLNQTLKHLEEQVALNCDAQRVIEGSLEKLDALKICTNCADLEINYNDVREKLQEVERENEALLKKIADQESLIGPFRELLTEYEALMGEKSHIEQEAKEIGIKYAQLLGHQNQKQKIKHLIDLKKKNSDLSETITELEAKNRQQARTIEKLKNELSLSTKLSKKKVCEDKENSNPNRTLNASFSFGREKRMH